MFFSSLGGMKNKMFVSLLGGMKNKMFLSSLETSFSSLGGSLELHVGPEFLLLQFLFLLFSMLFY
jgi:hypothetical protein